MKKKLLKVLLGVAIIIAPMLLNAQTVYTESFETDADVANWGVFVGATGFTTPAHNATEGVGGSGALKLTDGGFGFLIEHAISATIGNYYELTMDVKTQGWDDQATYPISITVEGMDANPSVAYINGLAGFTTITLVGIVTNSTGYIQIGGSNTGGSNTVWVDNINFTQYPPAKVTNNGALYSELFETDTDVTNWGVFVGATGFTTPAYNATGGVGGSGALELTDGGFSFLIEHAISATIGNYYELTMDVKTQGWDDQATYPISVTVEGMDANPSVAYINGLAGFTTITLVGIVTNSTGYIQIGGSNTGGSNTVWVDNITFSKITFDPFATDATLSDLTVDATTVSGFDAATIDYAVELPFGTTVVPTIAATTTDANAAAVITDAISLPGNSTVVVTAEDGVTVKTYTVQFTIAAANTDATLSDLTVDATTVSGFDAATIDYAVELPFGTTVVPAIAATTTDANAAAVITDAVSLPGNSTVVVTAEDGATVKTYTVQFTIAPSTDATLSDLTVDASTVTGFDVATIDYTVELPFGTTVVPTIGGTATDGNAGLVVTQAPSLPGDGTIEVTAEDGTTIKTYTVSFTIAANPSATLSDLTVDASTIANFDSNTIDYTVELPFGTTVIPTIGGTASSVDATVTVTQATALPGDATIFVEGLTATETYTVSFTIAPNTDATLSDLTVDASTVTGFDAATIAYIVELPFGTTTIPTIAGTATDGNAALVVTQAAQLPGDGTIEVTAEDGTTIKTYTVQFTMASANTDATLSDLTVDASSVTGFDAATIAYIVELPFGTTTVPTIAGTATDGNAALVVTQATQLPGNSSIQVTAEDGVTVKTYTVQFTVIANTDATLSDLTVDASTVTGFDAATIAYIVELPFGTTVVPTIAAAAADGNAALVVTQAAQLPGNATVEVTAEDGTTVKTYTVQFTIIANTDATLSDLTVDASTVSGFDAAIIDYTVELAFNTTEVPMIEGVATDDNAALVVTQAAQLPGDGTIEVTAEDGTTIKIYTVSFTIAPNTDATLSDLTVDASTVTSFDATTSVYEVELPFGTTAIPTVAGTATDDNAVLLVTQAAQLPGDATVEVTAEDGISVKTYEVRFTITPASTIATLNNLTVDGTTVDQFDIDVLSYDVEIESVTEVPTVAGIATDENATVVVTDATDLPGATTITITAEDGTTQLVYTINFRFNILGMPSGELSVNDMYPNPVLDVVNIRNTERIVRYSIIDLKGKVFIEGASNADSQISISTKSFESGLYLIRLISSEGEITTLKFIKK